MNRWKNLNCQKGRIKLENISERCDVSVVNLPNKYDFKNDWWFFFHCSKRWVIPWFVWFVHLQTCIYDQQIDRSKSQCSVNFSFIPLILSNKVTREQIHVVLQNIDRLVFQTINSDKRLMFLFDSMATKGLLTVVLLCVFITSFVWRCAKIFQWIRHINEYLMEIYRLHCSYHKIGKLSGKIGVYWSSPGWRRRNIRTLSPRLK